MGRDQSTSGQSYEGAGVSLEEADAFTGRLKNLLPKTFRKGCVPLPGGFAGLFDLKKEGLDDGCLVMATDGVGTKLKLAIEHQVYSTVGIDLVAMSVNDILTVGAQPLCFLDYIAYAELDGGVLDSIVASIAEGCLQSGCALVGGETAQMPGMYTAGDFDLAGFCVGFVKRNQLMSDRKVQAGDQIIGVNSSGVHSNGFSLVRSIIDGVPKSELLPYLSALLAPTKIYVRQVLKLMETIRLSGMAHITGGGLPGNVNRVMPQGLRASINSQSWQPAKLFHWLQEKGNVAQEEMYRIFNMGIGYVIICRPSDSKAVINEFKDEAQIIGKVVVQKDSAAAGDCVVN